ncbi:MAG: ComF family protein [Pedobacter sp.]|nr:ComF family protein [Chitinophagaceae bacterium]
MFATIKSYLNDFSHLLYPHNCEGCGTDVLNDDGFLCAKCLHELPETGFINVADNPVEKSFYGRLKIEHAAAGYYFTKDGLLQHLISQLKYKRNKEMGIFLGKLLGYQLQASERFNNVEALLPLPLNERKEQKRGYNQAQLICDGIAEVWQKPVLSNAVVRTVFTQSQTNKNRVDRWQNMEGVFAVAHANQLANKHILLVDDITTTGATLEACGNEILQVPNTKLSILTVAFTI